MIFRPFEPGDLNAWLKFMALAQAHSDAWEALYTPSPTIQSGL